MLRGLNSYQKTKFRVRGFFFPLAYKSEKVQPLTMSIIYDLLGRSIEPSQVKLGVEIERFGKDATGRMIRYETHLKIFFKEMIESRGWSPAYQVGDEIMAIERLGDQWSLEPGSQLELSAGPCASLHELKEQQERLEHEAATMKSAEGWSWNWLGLNPDEDAESIKIIPSPRYAIMTEYFKKNGGRGLDMMRLTTGCHVNFDYWCPDHAMKILRVGAMIAPTFVALFANSPFFKGRFSGRLSERVGIWQKTDPLRSGIPEFLFLKQACQNGAEASMHDYVNLVESTPLMFYFDESDKAHPALGKSWRDLSKDLQKKNALPAIRQQFLETRLKPCCVELRFLDQNEPAIRMSSFAMLVGLLQDPQTLEVLNKEAFNKTASGILKEMDQASYVGLKDDYFYETAKKYLQLASRGLSERKLGEEKFLQPIEEILKLRKNPAQQLLDSKMALEFQG